MKPTDEFNQSGEPENGYLEIGGVGSGRRVMGWIGYIALFVAVSIVLVAVFQHFTASLRLAMGLVLFMVAYMGVMGWLAGRSIERRETDDAGMR
ncbi:MAG: hypothetical protein ACREIT_01285 [Tepidisphaeraceae bacterium]